MKILIVNDYGTTTGGAEIMMLALRDGLRQRGHDARLFTSCAQVGTNSSLADYKCFGTASRFRTLLQVFNPWALWRLHQVLAEFRPDVVHVSLFLTQLSPLILPLLRDIPCLYHVHWYRPICPLGTKLLPDGTICQFHAGMACYRNHCLPLCDWLPLMLQMKLWQRWRSSFDLVVAVSKTVKCRLIAEGIAPVEVVWNGIPIQPSRPPLSSPPTVAFAGRLVREKGVDVLLSAFSKVVNQIPDAQLLLAGDGPERDRLNGMIASLRLFPNVTHLGHLPHLDVNNHFATAWVQAIPSRWSEGLPLVAIEAMMRGTAVVGSSPGGLTEVVRDGQTGFLVPLGNADALAEALLHLLRNRGLAEQMGKAGREVALAHFSEVSFIDSFVQLYQMLSTSAKLH